MSHMTVAASETAFKELFAGIRDAFTFADADSIDFGPFSAGYSLAFHLEGGDVDLRGDNTVAIKELDIKWDAFEFWVGIDIPEICVGGWCVFPTPFGCALRLPKICIFEDDPDIKPTLDLCGLITSEVSVVARLLAKYFTNPARQPWMNDHDAHDASVANEWQIFVDPEFVNLDVFDIADIVGDLLEDAVNFLIDDILGFLPGWARDLIKAILGPVIDVVRAILDLPDDFQFWISDLLDTSFGVLDAVVGAVAGYFAAEMPIHKFEDPIQVLKPNGVLIPVLVPIRDLKVQNDDVEMVVEANVG